MKRVVFAFAAWVLAACGGTTNGKYDQTQNAVTPKGSITVRILDASNYQPLSDVNITILGSSKTLTTDATGVASFTDAVVASNYTFVFEKQGYLRVTSGASLSSSAGNSPLAGSVTTLNVNMYKADANLKGFVFLPNGTPAKKATVMIDQRSYGESVVSGTTGDDGSFSLTGLAGTPTGISLGLIAQYFDENNDGQPDYPSSSVAFRSFSGGTARVFLTYSPSGSLTQKIIGSNVLDGSIPSGTDLSFTFALPVQSSNFNGSAANAFLLLDLTHTTITPSFCFQNPTTAGCVFVATSASWSSDSTVTVKPAAALVAGQRYAVNVSVTNANATGSNASPNFTTTLNFQVRPDSVVGITTQVTNLSVQNTSNAAIYDWNTGSFKIQWDGVPGAVSYNIYAKDTKANPDWVFLTNVSATGASRLVASVALTTSFNMFPAVTSPLANGNVVTFSVVPVDNYGTISPIASAPTAAVQDNTQPTWSTGLTKVTTFQSTGNVDAINEDTTPATIVFRISSSEPMDPTSPPLFTGQGGATATWAWDATNSAFTMTLAIPAGADATGPFLIRGGKDSSGNTILNGDIQGTLGGYKELIAHPGFEDGATCALTGWTADSAGNMTTATNVTTAAGTGQSGRCSAVLGTPTNTTAQIGSARVYQDIGFPTIPSTSGWQLLPHITTRGTVITGGTPGYQRCRITDASNESVVLVTLLEQNPSTTYSSSSSAPAFPIPVSPPSRLRFFCEMNNNQGGAQASNVTLYVDDIGVLLYKPGTY